MTLKFGFLRGVKGKMKLAIIAASMLVLSNALVPQQVQHASRTCSGIDTATSLTSLKASKYDKLHGYSDDEFYADMDTYTRNMFPVNFLPKDSRELPDFATLEPNDPLFLDMPWPTEKGPAATAFAKHMQWRRRLTDGERKSWQKWAIYERIMKKDFFQYSLEDYTFQSLLKEINKEVQSAEQEGNKAKYTAWEVIRQAYKMKIETEVEASMESFYAILNRRSFAELHQLLLPDDTTEIILPGYEKARGHFKGEQLFRRMAEYARPFGKIEPNIVSCQTFGHVAVCLTVETIVEGSEIKAVRKQRGRRVKPEKPPAAKKLFAVTVWRKSNGQWRIQTHHTSKFSTSAFTANQIPLEGKFLDKSSRLPLGKGDTALPSADVKALASELKSKVSLSSLVNSQDKIIELADFAKRGQRLIEDIEKEQEMLKQAGTPDEILKQTESITSKMKSLREEMDSMNEKKSQWEKDSEESPSALGGKAIQLSGADQKMLDSFLGGAVEKLKSSDIANIPGAFRRGSDGRLYIDTDNLNDGKGSTSGQSKGKSDDSTDDDSSPEPSLSKQAALAVRALHKVGKLSREDKNELLMDIIQCIATESQSRVETAYDLLVMQSRAKDDNYNSVSTTTGGMVLAPWIPNADDAGMEDFLDQCLAIIRGVKTLDTESIRPTSRKAGMGKGPIRNDNKNIEIDYDTYEDEDDDDNDSEGGFGIDVEEVSAIDKIVRKFSNRGGDGSAVSPALILDDEHDDFGDDDDDDDVNDDDDDDYDGDEDDSYDDDLDRVYHSDISIDG